MASDSVDAHSVMNGVVLLVAPIIGFLFGAGLGLFVGLGVGLAFVWIVDEVEQLSESVNTLESENQALKERLAKLEETAENDE